MEELYSVCEHPGVQILIGPHRVWAGSKFLNPDCIEQVDLLVAVGGHLPVQPGEICSTPVLWLPLEDFGGVPHDWYRLLVEKVIPQLDEGKRLAFFCHAGHGRTGTILASLVALLEPDTDDPIEAIRSRYCREAVETRKQIEAVFALRDENPPSRYNTKFGGQPLSGKKDE